MRNPSALTKYIYFYRVAPQSTYIQKLEIVVILQLDRELGIWMSSVKHM